MKPDYELAFERGEITQKAVEACRQGIPLDELFSPRSLSGERLTLRVEAQKLARISRRENRVRGKNLGTVTDLITGKHYRIEAANCSLPNCCCDCIATEIRR